MSRAAALKRLREYVQGDTVQPGMFSTLQEIIRAAPFETNTGQEWLNYLKPGRMLNREGVQFPLKKEELRFTGEFGLDDMLNPDQRYTRDELVGLIRDNSEGFQVSVGRQNYSMNPAANIEQIETIEQTLPESWEELRGLVDDLPDELRYMQIGDYLDENTVLGVEVFRPKWGGEHGGERLAHRSPGGYYEESVTRRPMLNHPSHFTDDTLSWSRTSTHNTGRGHSDADWVDPESSLPDTPPNKNVRLVEEIQSDLHSAAAERIYWNPETGRTYNREVYDNLRPEDQARLEVRRRGYMTQDAEMDLEDVQEEIGLLENQYEEYRGTGATQYNEDIRDELTRLRRREEVLSRGVQEAPYSNPSEYAALELRKQLLNAVDADEDYLALTRGQDQIDRYRAGMDERRSAGMRYMYDQVYLKELEKLARRYGANLTTVRVPLSAAADMRPRILAEYEMEDIRDLTEMTRDYIDEASDYVDIKEAISDVESTLAHVESEAAGNIEFITPDQNPEGITELRRELRAIEETLADNYVGAASGDSEIALENYQSAANNFDDFAKRWEKIYNRYEDLYAAQGSRLLKDFPAIELTPELKEKIKEIGVPQFAMGGVVRMFEGGGVEESPWPWVSEMTPEQWREWHLQQEALNRLRRMQEEYEDEEYARRWQEGEDYEDDSLLQKYLKATTRSLAGAVPGLPDETREWLSDTMRYPFVGLASQWQTLDPETGEASFVMPRMEVPPPTGMYGYMPTGIPEAEEARERINAEIRQLAEDKPFRPNIIDETLAIAALPKEFGWTEWAPEFATEALERSALVGADVERDLDVPPPRGFTQGTALGSGIMLGQVPIPGSQFKTLARPFTATRARRAMTAPVRAGIEFFSPVVTPSARTYGMGSLFSGALSEIPEWLPPSLEEATTEAEQLAMIREDMRREDMVADTWSDIETWDDKLQVLSDPEVGDVFWYYLSDDEKDAVVEEMRERGYEVGDWREDDAE